MAAIEVLDLREVTCSGSLHIDRAERMASHLLATHETQLAWAYERNARVMLWQARRIGEIKHEGRWAFRLWQLGLESFVLRAKERETQAMVNQCRPDASTVGEELRS